MTCVGLATGCPSGVVLGLYQEGPSGDAGALDAGALDSGAFDSGALDSGVDLSVSVSGSWVVEVDAGFTLDVFVENVGTAPSLDTRLDLGWSGVRLLGSNRCVAAGGGAQCDLGVLAGGASARVASPLDFGTTPQWFDVSTRASSSSLDVNRGNDYVVFPVALTPIGTTVVPLTGERSLAVTLCVGLAVRAFSDCDGGTQSGGTTLLHPDGGIEDPRGAHGYWGRSAHGRNVAWRVLPAGPRGASFTGASVSSQCFEGLYDDGSGALVSGAWRGCLP